jgi:hypothetical protein
MMTRIIHFIARSNYHSIQQWTDSPALHTIPKESAAGPKIMALLEGKSLNSNNYLKINIYPAAEEGLGIVYNFKPQFLSVTFITPNFRYK